VNRIISNESKKYGIKVQKLYLFLTMHHKCIGRILFNFKNLFNMSNKKVSSNEMAKIAAQTLNDDNASKIAKKLAGSVLSQANPDHQTSKEMEKTASDVMKSEKYSDGTKSLAASVLSQANKENK
jgi:hypothetical protein